MLRYKNKN